MRIRSIFLLLAPLALMAQTTATSSWRWRLAEAPELTPSERLKLYLHNNFTSAGGVFRALGPALGSHLGKQPQEWGRTGEGLGRRVAVSAATNSSRELISSGSAAMLGHDPRYQKCECKGFGQRLIHAMSGTILLADSSGRRRLDPSHLIASYSSGFVGASLYPDRYSLRVKGIQLGHQQFAQVTLENVAMEFGPDVKRFLRQKVLRRP